MTQPSAITPHLVREDLVLDQKTVASLKLPPGPGEVIIVANKLRLAGATFTDKDVLIFADQVQSQVQFSRTGITLTRSGPAPTNTTGEPGCRLTIWTRIIGTAGGRSFGQTGGVGLPGAPAQDLVCPTQPGPIDPEPGVQGGQGKPGAKGGRGGPITINIVGTALDGSTPPPGPQDWLGAGGGAGQGGPGGAGGRGCPRFDHLTGPEGPIGGTLGKGDDVAALVRPVNEQELIDEFLRRAHAHTWASVRMRAADKLARLGLPGEAEQQLRAVERLEFFSAITDGIRRRMRHRLTSFGVESDVDVRPAIDQHRATWENAVAAYEKMVLPLGGHSVFLTPDATQMQNLHGQLLIDHTPLATSELELLRSERDERISNLVDARQPLGDLVQACRDRIADSDAPPTITLPGGTTMTAGALADRITSLLAALPGPGRPDDTATRRLLAADPDLLAPAAANEAYPMPGTAPSGPTPEQQALVSLRAAGVGLAGAAPGTPQQPNPADWATPAVVVSFGRLRADLTAADGDPRLLLELAELAELAHRSRLVQLRQLQADEAFFVQRDLADTFASNQHILTFPPDETFPVQVLGPRYLRAVRDAAEVLAWRSHAAERSVALYTLDSTSAAERHPESAVMPTVRATGSLFDPDPEEQLQNAPEAAGPVLDFFLTQAGAEDADVRLAQYRGRGVFHEGAGESPVDPLGFDSDEHPEVLARLRFNRNVWFRATLDRLSQARFEHKVVGVGFTFTGLREPAGQPPTRERRLTVEHSGISEQRRLDGAVIRQHLLPAEVSVTVRQLPVPNTGTFSDTWSGFMRFDQKPPQPDPQNPGQTVTQAAAFPFWGRGAAAGWRFRFDDLVDLSALTRFEFEVEYDGFVAPGQTSLRRIEQPLGALVPGRTVQARAVLTGQAPAGGLKVSLKSDNPAALTVPAFITVPAGSDRANLPVTVVAPSGKAPVQITATSPDGFSRRALAFAAAPAPNQPATVTTLDLKLPGDVNGNVGGLAFDGDRLIGSYGPALLHPDGTLEGTGPGGMVGIPTSAAGMGAAQRFAFGGRMRSVAIANRRAYLISGDVDALGLTIVDLVTNKQLVHVPSSFGQTQVTVDPAANLAYVSNFAQRTVDVHHGSTGVKLGSVAGIRGPQGSAFDGRRRRLYVACSFQSNGPADAENGLAVIDRTAAGGHVLNRIIPMEGRNLPMDVAFDSSRDLVHVANIGVAGEHAPGITTFRGSDLAMLGHTAVPGPLICCDVHLETGAVVCGGPAPSVHVVDGVARRHVMSHPVTTNVQCIVVHQASAAIFTGDRVSGVVARLAPVEIAATAWR